jgi:hypothetical protein
MTYKLAEETAKAWRLDVREVLDISKWVDENVNTSSRYIVFAQVLRKHYVPAKDQLELL